MKVSHKYAAYLNIENLSPRVLVFKNNMRGDTLGAMTLCKRYTNVSRASLSRLCRFAARNKPHKINIFSDGWSVEWIVERH